MIHRNFKLTYLFSAIGFALIYLLNNYSSVTAKERTFVAPAIVQTDQYFPLVKDKRVGVVANHTSLLGRFHLIDTLRGAGINVKVIFAPEHGFRGKKGAGEKVDNSVDSVTGIRVVSLYGKNLGPSKADLKDIDVLIFDIQDVGIRFYTYISTLQYVMEACAENKIPLIVLDRPNPHSFYVDGPVLDMNEKSFVGMQPVPVVYGMTIGEYARMLNGEGWLSNKVKCDLQVIKIKNYTHKNKYQLPVPPSPNLPDMDAIYLYPSICFFEGTKISLGRGTNKPFRLIGFPGNKNDTVKFTPKEIEGVTKNPPYEDTLCTGIDLSKEGKKLILSKKLNLTWLIRMYRLYPDTANFFTPFFEKLSGTQELRQQIIQGKTEEEIRLSWKPALENFMQIRKKYLLYEDF